MASKRKSTVPCMIPVKTVAVEAGNVETVEAPEVQQLDSPCEKAVVQATVKDTVGGLANGHQNFREGRHCICKYCDFLSPDLNKFLLHVESQHLEFNVDPNFVCVQCSFLVKSFEGLASHNAENHAEERSFVWSVAKEDSQVIVEQTFPGAVHSPAVKSEVSEDHQTSSTEISRIKTPIMKMVKSKPEQKRIAVVQLQDKTSSVSGSEKEAPRGSRNSAKCTVNGTTTVVPLVGNTTKSSQPPKCSVINALPILQTGVTQIVPLVQPLQQQPVLQPQTILPQPQLQHQSRHLPNTSALPKVMIPLTSIPGYNPDMDSNSFLRNSFNKFPYPTKSELCWLTVVTKYAEEQIKIWFTANRLKQGISWSPEEVEDSRRKMFNTIIQTVPQPTITLLNAPLATSGSGVQQVIHSGLPCQVVGQPGTTGVLVAQPLVTNGVQVTNSQITLAVSTPPNQQVISTVQCGMPSDVNVVSTVHSLTASPNISSDLGYVDHNSNKIKKSQQQLTALKDSFYKNQFPDQEEVERLSQNTGIPSREVKKWFSDRRYHQRNLKGTRPLLLDEATKKTAVTDPYDDDYFSLLGVSPQHSSRRPSFSQAPDFTPIKYKERAPEQLKALENSFEQNPFPSEEEVDRLRSETKMTRREIDSWFSERRKRKTTEDSLNQTKEAIEFGDYVEDVDGSEHGDNENIEPEDDDEYSARRRIRKTKSLLRTSSMQGSEQKVLPIKINLKNLRVTDGSSKPFVHTSSQERERRARPAFIARKKTNEQLHMLKRVFVHTQWPSNEQYDALVAETGLSRTDVVRWFGDTRYAFKNKQLKWVDNYSKNAFPEALHADESNSQDMLLEDSFGTHEAMYDDGDLESLGEKTEMSQEDNNWFNENTSKDADSPSNSCNEEQQSFSDEQSRHYQEGDAGSETSESSDHRSTNTNGDCTDQPKEDSHIPEIPLESE
ncbi:zinc fingers and homeoboxes protein 3 isoform X2 [Protopterus annectens]|uniref:zinc fingers and homeoboxes protein 3 isoform X2 n=1 Tax=Protopterus annectens TaxID=7888 RepID=UPI001CFA022B|nr:zinc fingers and homeoboxes protein 3 isoform X2 [Protopterus annectens]